jgi:hypothetical protein
MTAPKDPEWQGSGPSLDASGNLVGGQKAKGAPGADAFAPPETKDEKLELDTARMHKGPNEWSEPAPYRDDHAVAQQRRRRLLLAGGIAALGLAAVVAFMTMPKLQRLLPWKLPGATAGSMLITSEPSGAEVRISGVVAGQTPFAADNRFVGRAPLELRLEGYEPFKDVIQGGRDVHIAATLHKK